MATLEQVFNQARQRVLAGEQLTITEQRELVTLLRQNRFSAAETSSASKTKKATTKALANGVSDADLDAQLGDLGL